MPKHLQDENKEIIENNEWEGERSNAIHKVKMKEMDTYDKGEKDIYAYDESDPLSVRERK